MSMVDRIFEQDLAETLMSDSDYEFLERTDLRLFPLKPITPSNLMMWYNKYPRFSSLSVPDYWVDFKHLMFATVCVTKFLDTFLDIVPLEDVSKWAQISPRESYALVRELGIDNHEDWSKFYLEKNSYEYFTQCTLILDLADSNKRLFWDIQFIVKEPADVDSYLDIKIQIKLLGNTQYDKSVTHTKEICLRDLNRSTVNKIIKEAVDSNSIWLR